MFTRLSKFLTKPLMRKFYCSKIQPCLDYADTIWMTCNKSQRNDLQGQQNRAARIITKNYDYINHRGIEIASELNLMTLQNRRNYRLTCLMFKCMHGLAPTYLTDRITLNCDIHEYGTRAALNDDLYVPTAKTECLRKTFLYNGAITWNNLPVNLKQIPTLECFKSSCFKHFMSLNSN